MMNEYPIFVPVGREHVAAVITVPDTPRGLVQLLQGGGGQSRTHRNRSWIRAARGLAEKGIASVHMDYPGLGDSTGVRAFEMGSPPVDAALAVARVALDAVGVERFAAVGNCIGIPTALETATRIPSCMAVVCIAPTALGPLMGVRRVKRRESARRAIGQRMPALRHVVRTLKPSRGGGSAAPTRLRPEMATLLRSASILILHGGTEDSWRQLRTQISRLRAEVGEDTAQRLETGVLPTEGSGFRELHIQQVMVDSSIEWLDQAFFPLRPAALEALETQAGAH
jgi:pimeloyl-ACP methyl ester carboxylesterase